MTATTVVVVYPPEGTPPPVERLPADVDVLLVQSEKELRAALPGVEVMFLNDFRTELLRRVGPGDLRWIHTSSLGVDALLAPSIVDSQVVVTNSRGVCERPIAEWVLAAVLLFAKDIQRSIHLQMQQIWLHRETESVLDRRALVLGPGGVGRETTLLLRAAGMTVDVVGRTERIDPDLGSIHAEAALDRLLPEVDDVVLALPLNDATRHIIDDRRLELMRPGARIFNVGRGALVDQDALAAALANGHIGAAALDVFDQEPLPSGHPLWTMDNVLVSPHMSGDLVGWRDRVVDSFAANLERWRAGAPLQNVVDLREHGASRSALVGQPRPGA